MVVAEDDRLCLAVGVQLGLWRRVAGRLLELVHCEGLCRLSDHGLVGASLQGLSGVDVLRLTGVRRLDVAADGKDSVWSRHLQEKICVVWDRHELGESWSPQYSMVGSLERGHLEDDRLRAVVVPCAEGDGEGDLANRS